MSTKDDQDGFGYKQIYDIGKAGHQYSMEAIAVAVFIHRVLKGLVDLNAYPWLIMLRHEFGERFLNGWIAFLTAMIMSFVAVVTGSLIGQFMATSLVVFWVSHKIRIKRRNRHGLRWHSRSNGVSRILQVLPNLAPGRVDQIYEPLFLMSLGLLMMALTHGGDGLLGAGFGLFMVIGGICLHIHHAENHKKHRHLLLDQIDSQIVSENFADALSGDANAYQTDGFVVQGAEEWSPNERQLITDAVMAQPAH